MQRRPVCAELRCGKWNGAGQRLSGREEFCFQLFTPAQLSSEELPLFTSGMLCNDCTGDWRTGGNERGSAAGAEQRQRQRPSLSLSLSPSASAHQPQPISDDGRRMTGTGTERRASGCASPTPKEQLNCLLSSRRYSVRFLFSRPVRSRRPRRRQQHPCHSLPSRAPSADPPPHPLCGESYRHR